MYIYTVITEGWVRKNIRKLVENKEVNTKCGNGLKMNERKLSIIFLALYILQNIVLPGSIQQGYGGIPVKTGP